MTEHERVIVVIVALVILIAFLFIAHVLYDLNKKCNNDEGLYWQMWKIQSEVNKNLNTRIKRLKRSIEHENYKKDEDIKKNGKKVQQSKTKNDGENYD